MDPNDEYDTIFRSMIVPIDYDYLALPEENPNNIQLKNIIYRMIYLLWPYDLSDDKHLDQKKEFFKDIINYLKSKMGASDFDTIIDGTFSWLNDLADFAPDENHFKNEMKELLEKLFKADERIGKKKYFSADKKTEWNTTKKAMLYLQIIKLLPPREPELPDKWEELAELDQFTNEIQDKVIPRKSSADDEERDNEDTRNGLLYLGRYILDHMNTSGTQAGGGPVDSAYEDKIFSIRYNLIEILKLYEKNSNIKNKEKLVKLIFEYAKLNLKKNNQLTDENKNNLKNYYNYIIENKNINISDIINFFNKVFIYSSKVEVQKSKSVPSSEGVVTNTTPTSEELLKTAAINHNNKKINYNDINVSILDSSKIQRLNHVALFLIKQFTDKKTIYTNLSNLSEALAANLDESTDDTMAILLNNIILCYNYYYNKEISFEYITPLFFKTESINLKQFDSLSKNLNNKNNILLDLFIVEIPEEISKKYLKYKSKYIIFKKKINNNKLT